MKLLTLRFTRSWLCLWVVTETCKGWFRQYAQATVEPVREEASGFLSDTMATLQSLQRFVAVI